MMVKIAVGENDMGHVDNRSVQWDKLADVLTKHQQADAKGGRFFVGGYFTGNERKEANLVERTLLTFDADAIGMTLDDVELALRMNIDAAVAAYSTYNHAPDAPRLRIVIPLSRGVSAAEYRDLAKLVGDAIDIPFDACSYKANQFMYMPTCPDVSKAWSLCVEGKPLQVGDYLNNVVSIAPPKHTAPDDLEAALAAQPLDLTEAQVIDYLKALAPADMAYESWIKVGAALHHQFAGSNRGLEVWDQWSRQDAARYDQGVMAAKWRSFGNSSRVITFASVIYQVKDSGGLGTVATTDDTGATPFDALLQEAAAVHDRSGYQALADRVKAMPSNLLADVDRSMLVEALHKGWPRSVGIGKVDVRKSLTPAKRSSGSGELGFSKDWVYVEVPCEFRNIELNYAIKREAFNTKFANEPVVLLDGRQASVLVSESPDFVSVVDTMYWPGAQTLFDYAGRTMLNSYRDTRVLPSTTLDADGQAAVDLFLSHAAIILPDQVERNIMLDWLAYVVQNPGKRINWAIFLQGIAGAGKTYFPGVVRDILGEGNTNEVTVDALVSSFTGYAEGSILAIVEELRLSGESKYMIIDKLKPFITNDVISVVTKGKDARTVPNFTSYFMLSNFKDAIPVDDTDRRYCVLYSAIQTEADLMDAFGDKDAKDAYFTTLFDSKDDNLEALAHYLLTRKLGAGFKPKGSAPMTNAKMEMRDLAVTDDTTLVIDAISEHACGIIGEHIVDVTYLAKLAMLDGDEFPQTTRVKKIMMELGYSYCGGNNRPNIPHKTGSAKRSRHSVWFKKPETVLTANAKVIEFHTDPDYVPF
jgi:hypothetical protein